MTDDGSSDDGQPISVLGNTGFDPSWSVSGPSVLGGVASVPAWSPADSSLNFFVDPDTMKTIDFGDTATDQGQPQPPQPDPSLPDGTQAAADQPLTTWPVPGHTQLNERDVTKHQGDGAFGSVRNHDGRRHTGIDITAPVGTPVVAAGDGTVANIQPNPSTTYGNQVVIAHPDSVYTQYGHLSRIDVAPGVTVHAGDQIGLSGASGDVPKKPDGMPLADPHLHFEVRRGSMRPHSTGGQVVDPTQYLPVTP